MFSCKFTGRTDAEAEAPILCPPDVKSRLIEKTLMKKKRKEKTLMLGETEGRRRRGRQGGDEMVGWHH